jgi:hypothetical protein
MPRSRGRNLEVFDQTVHGAAHAMWLGAINGDVIMQISEVMTDDLKTSGRSGPSGTLLS